MKKPSAELSRAAAMLGRKGGVRRWAENSTNGKPSPDWREMSRKGGQARASQWASRAIRKAYKRARKPAPAIISAITDEILKRWPTGTVQSIADELDIHPDTVRKRVRVARRNGDPRAFSKRPDLERKS